MVEDLVDMLLMSCRISGVDEDVIKVHNDRDIKEIREDAVMVRGLDFIFSVVHWSPLSLDSLLTFTLSAVFSTDTYQYIVW